MNTVNLLLPHPVAMKAIKGKKYEERNVRNLLCAIPSPPSTQSPVMLILLSAF